MNKNNFKVGVNFDFELLHKLIELNEQYGQNKITELYGSIRNDAALAARPDFRLPDVSNQRLEKYVRIAKDAGIDFNYTLNSFMPYGSKVELNENKDKIKELVKRLEGIGVYRITIANPLLLKIIRDYIKSNIEIEVSTCAHIDTVTQIKYYHEVYGVNKVCGNLNKNRDFNFLKAASEYCNKNGIIYELMANEFCGVGGEGYATHCIYRDSCYMCHATNKTYEDSMLFDNYPMRLCTLARDKDVTNWLKSKWIRPEDLKYYNDIGLRHFKITGRTGSTEYILKTIQVYLEESFDGNLIELWKPLQSITMGVSETQVKKLYIDNNKLEGFLKYWGTGHNCDYEICGETCRYCNKFYEDKIEEDK